MTTEIFTPDHEDISSPIKLYASDKDVIINYGTTDDAFCGALEAYCETNNYEWDYSDSIVQDYDMGIAYRADSFGNYPDVIMLNEPLGRAGFDDKTHSWEDIAEAFVNKPTMALPEWFPVEQLTDDGFVLQSCDFAAGWHGKADNPKTILDNTNENEDIVFQLSYVEMFEIGFCVWKRVNEATADRYCDKCGDPMFDGYCIGDGEQYICSDECLFVDGYTAEQRDLDYEDGSIYYTTWED